MRNTNPESKTTFKKNYRVTFPFLLFLPVGVSLGSAETVGSSLGSALTVGDKEAVGLSEGTSLGWSLTEG
jgi:hypothetical protein